MRLSNDTALLESGGRRLPSAASAGAATRCRRLIDARGARLAKRALDIAAASVLLLLGTPLCLLVGVAIRLEDGGPALFRQTRVGRNGRLFTLYKLRSMRLDAEADGGPRWAAPDDARATRIGRWIRALRIDEIPQAWNILAGEMSFVGPRPERPTFVDLLRAEIPSYEQRHCVRPGLTGWAQVNQPYSGNIADARRKLAYDLEYIENWSVVLDVRILVRTAELLLLEMGPRSTAA